MMGCCAEPTFLLSPGIAFTPAGINFTQTGPVLKVRGEVLVGPDFAPALNDNTKGYNPQGFTTHVRPLASSLAMV